MKYYIGPAFSSASDLQWDVNIVEYHLHKPNHHLIPELVISNKVFYCWQVNKKHLKIKRHIPRSVSREEAPLALTKLS